jgi:hypothetical protein
MWNTVFHRNPIHRNVVIKTFQFRYILNKKLWTATTLRLHENDDVIEIKRFGVSPDLICGLS